MVYGSKCWPIAACILTHKPKNIMLATQFLGGRRATSCRRLYDAQRRHSNVRDEDSL